jgi:hypothetical protein
MLRYSSSIIQPVISNVGLAASTLQIVPLAQLIELKPLLVPAVMHFMRSTIPVLLVTTLVVPALLLVGARPVILMSLGSLITQHVYVRMDIMTMELKMGPANRATLDV